MFSTSLVFLFISIFPWRCVVLAHRLFRFLGVRVFVQDLMDDICQEQFMEMSYLNGGQEHGGRGRGGMPVRGRGVPPAGAHRCGDREIIHTHTSLFTLEMDEDRVSPLLYLIIF